METLSMTTVWRDEPPSYPGPGTSAIRKQAHQPARSFALNCGSSLVSPGHRPHTEDSVLSLSGSTSALKHPITWLHHISRPLGNISKRQSCSPFGKGLYQPTQCIFRHSHITMKRHATLAWVREKEKQNKPKHKTMAWDARDY